MVADPGSVVAELSGNVARWIDARRGAHQGDASLRVVEITALDVIDHGRPALVHAVVSMGYRGASENHHAVLAVGDAVPRDVALADVVGTLRDDAVVWDALADPVSLDRLLPLVSPGLVARGCRRVEHAAGHTTVSSDGTWTAIFFHRAVSGVHPEVAMSRDLASVGSDSPPVTRSVWSRSGCDLALVRTGGGGGRDAGGLAAASLAQVLDRRTPPHRSGLDVAPAMARLGSELGRMHVASAEARGSEPLTGSDLSRHLTQQFGSYPEGSTGSDRLVDAVARLGAARDLGRSIAPHGRVGLDRILRRDHDDGWTFADAGRIDRTDEPPRTSPLSDVAQLVVELEDVADVAVRSRGADGASDETELLTASWETRLSESLVAGYVAVPGVTDLLPPDPPASDALLRLYELSARTVSGLPKGRPADARRIPSPSADRLVHPLTVGGVDD